MIDFSLTPGQVELREPVRNFVREDFWHRMARYLLLSGYNLMSLMGMTLLCTRLFLPRATV